MRMHSKPACPKPIKYIMGAFALRSNSERELGSVFVSKRFYVIAVYWQGATYVSGNPTTKCSEFSGHQIRNSLMVRRLHAN